MRVKLINEKIAFNDDIHIGDSFSHKSGYTVTFKDIYILGSKEPVIVYERSDRPGKLIKIEGSEKMSVLLDALSRNGDEFFTRRGMHEAFGSLVIPYGDKGKKFKIGKNTKEQDVKKAIEWIIAYVPKIVGDKHVEDAKIRMAWGVKFLNALYKKNLLGEYDFKVAYNNLCARVKSNSELARMYEPYRLNNNTSNTKNENLNEETEDEKRKKRFRYDVIFPGDIEEPLDRFNHQVSDNRDAVADVMTGNSHGEGDSASASSGGGGMGESYDPELPINPPDYDEEPTDMEIWEIEDSIRREVLSEHPMELLNAFISSIENSNLDFSDFEDYTNEDMIEDYISNHEYWDKEFEEYIEDEVNERLGQ